MVRNLLFLCVLFILSNMNAQVFQENWDGTGPGIEAWTLINEDGLTPAEAVNFVTDAWVTIDRGGEPPNFGGPDGDFAAVSTSWYNPAGTANDWLISPEITIDSEDLFLFWDAKAQDGEYPDGYALMISPTGGSTIADFTETLFSIEEENFAWITRGVDLAAYVGNTVRFAWVNNSTDKFVLLVDNIIVESSTLEVPNCPTLVSPTDAATGLEVEDGVTLIWEAAADGGEPSTYELYLGTSAEELEFLGSTPETTIDLTGLANETTYYWQIVAVNALGSAESCSILSFTTVPSVFSPYCGPLSFSFVEPITLVQFAGIDNASSVSTESSGHEAFLETTGAVQQAGTYEFTLQGSTEGDYENNIVVFIDWNQNNVLNDENEVYVFDEVLNNSTGEDGISVSHMIDVPADAALGTTRMRVKKLYGETNLADPCIGGTFGQTEDYTLSVSESMGTNDVLATKAMIYPNPAISKLEIKGLNVKSAQIYNTLGQQFKANFDNNVVNVNQLPKGVYILKVIDESGKATSFKFIKK